jgi:predicted nuclease with TOPRIM domain
MSEERALSEQTEPVQPAEKPKESFWNGALKKVKGESTARLIENFTAEMTLVAEGLWEDQSKLRRENDQMASETDRRIQRLESKIDNTDSALDEERTAHDQALTELRTRLAALEKKNAKEAGKGKKDRNLIRDLTWLIGVAGIVIVAILLVKHFLP